MALLALGCSSEETKIDGGNPANTGPAGDAMTAPTMTPECTAGSCFERCLCRGETTEQCSASCSEDAGVDDPVPTGSDARSLLTATFVMEAFDIPPGGEDFRCQNFANPFGHHVAVLRTDSFMTSGGHHMFAFQREGVVDGPLETCSGLEFGGNIHGSQLSQGRTTYPEGVGRFHGENQGVRLQVHYLNTSSETVRTEVAVTIHADELENVESLASLIFINTFGINVEPFSTGSAHNTCSVPHDVNVFTTGSHMHSRGVYFVARADDGQLLYETNEWAEPEPWKFDPPRRLREGTTISVDCEYDNPTDQRLSFGESAASNEMCIFSGTYYPAPLGEGISCLF
jgi:hypothetical protein